MTTTETKSHEATDKMNLLVRRMIETDEGKRYASKDYWTLEREYGCTPNGNPITGRWVLRDNQGLWIDCDRYRNDVSERNGLVLETPNRGLGK